MPSKGQLQQNLERKQEGLDNMKALEKALRDAQLENSKLSAVNARLRTELETEKSRVASAVAQQKHSRRLLFVERCLRLSVQCSVADKLPKIRASTKAVLDAHRQQAANADNARTAFEKKIRDCEAKAAEDIRALENKHRLVTLNLQRQISTAVCRAKQEATKREEAERYLGTEKQIRKDKEDQLEAVSEELDETRDRLNLVQAEADTLNAQMQELGAEADKVLEAAAERKERDDRRRQRNMSFLKRRLAETDAEAEVAGSDSDSGSDVDQRLLLAGIEDVSKLCG